MDGTTKTEALNLAQEIMVGVEDGVLPPERSLLKASRLARLLRDSDAEKWLDLERDGYDQATARKHNSFFASNRAFQDATHDIFPGVPVLAQRSKVLRLHLAQLRLPDVSGEYASIALRETRSDISLTANQIQYADSVLGAVEKRVHAYAVGIYHALSFDRAAESIFEAARAAIDPLLLSADRDLVKKLDYAARSLQGDDPEAVSAATNSLRRLLTAFADAVFPATDDVRVTADGQSIKLSSAQYLNRIKAFIDDNCPSDSRKRSLRQSLSQINERLSAGVHDEVTQVEAEFLLLKTYVTLGETLALRNPSAPVQ